MDYLIASLLAIIQGITEFLPVSSSAHLILPAQIFGIADQGLLFDTAVHGGTLLAVMSYYRQDMLAMLQSWTTGVRKTEQHQTRELALWLLVASIPVLVLGYVCYDFISTELRNVQVIAMTTIIFAPLLWWASRGNKPHSIPDMKVILLCGLLQPLALIPGVSRSGITITVAMAVGYDAQSAARISFLLSVPTIGAASAYGILQIINSGDFAGLMLALWGALLAGVFAYLTIGIFLGLIKQVGLLPFVVYRLLLGLVLLLFI